MKNILAENMLRFRSKNIAAQEAAAIRKLIEQVTTLPYKNPTDIEGFFTGTANGVISLDPRDVETVIFATKLKPGVTVYGAEAKNTNAIELPGTKLYLVVGQIGTVNDAVNPKVMDDKAGAILFGAEKAGDSSTGTSGRVGRTTFIPFRNNLVQFANDIVRATNPTAGNKVGQFGNIEKQIADVLKASAGLGITDADKLVDEKFYAAWKAATEKALAAA